MTPDRAKFGEVDGGTVLKRWRLVRKIDLQELYQIEEGSCAICSLHRELIYSMSYEWEPGTTAESFSVCQLCGLELMTKSERHIQEIKAEATHDAPEKKIARSEST